MNCGDQRLLNINNNERINIATTIIWPETQLFSRSLAYMLIQILFLFLFFFCIVIKKNEVKFFFFTQWMVSNLNLKYYKNVLHTTNRKCKD